MEFLPKIIFLARQLAPQCFTVTEDALSDLYSLFPLPLRRHRFPSHGLPEVACWRPGCVCAFLKAVLSPFPLPQNAINLTPSFLPDWWSYRCSLPSGFFFIELITPDSWNIHRDFCFPSFRRLLRSFPLVTASRRSFPN